MVEENEFRNTYNSINSTRCVFEKALLTKTCQCSRARGFRLAERVGFGCNHLLAQQRCAELLALMRNNARFTLGMPTVVGPLPHNKEIRVQIGGLRGLRKLCHEAEEETETIADVDATIEACIARYGSLAEIPYDRILPSIAAYQVKRWRRRRKSDPPRKDD